jgi:type IV secretory pathway VirB6-like protein
MNSIIQALRKVVGAQQFASLRKLALLSLLLPMLTACPKPDDTCVYADSWGEAETKVIEVPANEKFTSAAGLTVEKGEDIEVNISNDHIDICPNTTVFESFAKPVWDKANVNIVGFILPIDPKSDKWQQAGFKELKVPSPTAKFTDEGKITPIEVNKNTKISINVYKSYTDSNGEQTLGRGLYVYIGDEHPKDGDPKNISDAANWWYGQDYSGGSHTVSETTFNKKVTQNDNFFEMYDNGSMGTPGLSGFSGFAPADGTLWFKYARNASSRGIDNNGDGQASPWLGRYAWNTFDQCNTCASMPAVCAPALALAGVGYGICLTAGYAACAANGQFYQTEPPLIDERNMDGRHCREGKGGKHWVNSAYDGSDWDYADLVSGRQASTLSDAEKLEAKNKHANSGGYQISIGSGCQGTFGQFMEMHIGESVAALKDKTDPAGCVVGVDKHCDVVTDDWGVPVKLPEYSVPGANVTSMDMRPLIGGVKNTNQGFSSAGVYKDKLPATGELWFHIRDEAKSSAHPTPGYYGDNLGSYRVTVKTKPVGTALSDAFNALINPIRGMVFGYCRVDDPKLLYKVSKENCTGDYVDANNVTHKQWLPGITQMMYHKLVGVSADGSQVSSNPFLAAVRAALVLYVIIYAGLFMMGMVDDRQEGFLKRIIKFSIVAALLSASSWDFFNNFLFRLFTTGIDNFIGMLTVQFSPADFNILVDPVTHKAVKQGSNMGGTNMNIFAFADMTASKFFNLDSMKKIMGLLFATPLGIVYVMMIFVGLFLFLYSLVKAMILYLLALLAISLLLIVSPIFISFMLFEKTKEMFKSWVMNLINYTFQPVFVFAALSIFNIFVYSALYHLLHYTVCWRTVWWLDLNKIGIPTKLPLFDYYLTDNAAHLGSVPVQMFMIFIFIIICSAMLEFIDWMAKMAAQLTTTITSTSLTSTAGSTLGGATSIAKKIAGGALDGAKFGANKAKNAIRKAIK